MLLPLDMLVSVYMHLLSAILIFSANVLSRAYVEEEIEIIHNNGVGGSLYESHIQFMKTHLYEENNEKFNMKDETINTEPQSDIMNLPITIASIFKLSPLIRRLVSNLYFKIVLFQYLIVWWLYFPH